MLGQLKIDKSSLDMNYFLKSIRVVADAHGEISRYNFVRALDEYMNGTTSLPANQATDYVENRTQYNKSKLPRYFGFIDLKLKNGESFLVLTKRGFLLNEIIEEFQDSDTGKLKYRIIPSKREDFRNIIIESILYGTFGKNNSGVEQSHTDIEVPKIIFKSILALGYVTSLEVLFLAEGMIKKHIDSFEDGITIIRNKRTSNDYKEFMKSEMESLGMSNFAKDDKFISVYTDENINILKRSIENEEKRYSLNDQVFQNHKNEFQQLLPVYKPLQLIISGVPGTGKSYYIDKCILGGVSNTEQIIRTVIHPDYTYSDFVGYIQPEENLNYKFEPGPFTRALLNSFKYPNSNIYLVIEEINRGDIASIFGDIFQLLDRIDDYKLNNHGDSDYFITNEELYNYIYSELKSNNISTARLIKDSIFLPSNFNIIGTMNTADQNVYVLDTAFKRRFKNLYLTIDFSDSEKFGTYLYDLNELSKQKVFINAGSWRDFAEMVNRKIDSINRELMSISEDKKLAPYFIGFDDLVSKKSFCDKVIYYLKCDVFKYISGVLPESYEELYNEFVNEDKDWMTIFGE